MNGTARHLKYILFDVVSNIFFPTFAESSVFYTFRPFRSTPLDHMCFLLFTFWKVKGPTSLKEWGHKNIQEQHTSPNINIS
jgi:hypothetical protein